MFHLLLESVLLEFDHCLEIYFSALQYLNCVFMVFAVCSVALEIMQEAIELMHQCLLQKLPQSKTAIQLATKQCLQESTSAAVQQLKHVSV
jgi:hypothetical protein